MLKVVPKWFIRSKVHTYAIILCHFSESSNKNDKACLSGDEKTPDQANIDGDREKKNSREIQGFEKPKYQQNSSPKMRRSLSPGERLSALLPEEYKTKTDSESLSQNHNLQDTDKDNTQSNEKQNKANTRQSNDFMKQSFKARTRIQPSKRLASMLPQDYWQNVDDSETKQIVEDLSENTDSKKTPE